MTDLDYNKCIIANSTTAANSNVVTITATGTATQNIKVWSLNGDNMVESTGNPPYTYSLSEAWYDPETTIRLLCVTSGSASQQLTNKSQLNTSIRSECMIHMGVVVASQGINGNHNIFLDGEYVIKLYRPNTNPSKYILYFENLRRLIRVYNTEINIQLLNDYQELMTKHNADPNAHDITNTVADLLKNIELGDEAILKQLTAIINGLAPGMTPSDVALIVNEILQGMKPGMSDEELKALIDDVLSRYQIKPDEQYALIDHLHDDRYSYLTHKHNLIDIAGVESVAPADHNHDDAYAFKLHTHELQDITDVTSVAPADHNHDDVYSNLSHNHDLIYSGINHNHDYGYLYAGINHTHTSEIDDAIKAHENGIYHNDPALVKHGYHLGQDKYSTDPTTIMES